MLSANLLPDVYDYGPFTGGQRAGFLVDDGVNGHKWSGVIGGNNNQNKINISYEPTNLNGTR